MKSFSRLLSILFYSAVCLTTRALSPIAAQKNSSLQFFQLQDVQLLPGEFQEARQTDLNYILSMNVDKLLAPYLREAGLPKKTDGYPNWEGTGLDGHIGGHYLSSLSMMYASTGNKEVLRRLNYMVNELEKCQQQNGNGYIGGTPGGKAMWADVMAGKIDASSFSLNGKWVPLYNLHKTYAGLRDAYLVAGNEKAKTVLIKFSDWFVQLTTTLTPQQMELILRSEHGGINEVLADVYATTGDKKYLNAAYSFSHKTILEPLEKQQDKLDNLHANTQIPKVVGFERIAEVNHDSAYDTAARFFWETVITHRTIAIGGNSVREHFNPASNFSSMIESEQGPETCNTYNMLRLTKLLYQSQPMVKYIDYYERALYNHILSTQYPGKGGFVYFTPIRPGHYRVYSQPQSGMWCCVGSGLENHSKYNELIYAHNENELFVNLFIPSKLHWKEKGLTMTQQTRFPDEEKTSLLVNEATQQPFTINIRYPSWEAKGELKIKINGKEIQTNAMPSSYISIKRVWKKGDKIEVQLPMHNTTEKLPDGSSFVAVLHGPIVLAAKTDTTNMTGLFADDSRMGHVASGKKYPLNQMPLFVTNDSDVVSHITPIKGKPFTFKMNQLVYPASDSLMELIPFYRLHASRYVIYWQKETPQSFEAIRQKMVAEEAAAAKLAAITVDYVNAGEQQPEVDHAMQNEKSSAGVFRDRHYREAKGWFSYQMKDKENAARRLRVTYWGQDKNRSFNILVNNEKIAEVNLDGSQGDQLFFVDYPIPTNITKNSGGLLVVKFEAQENRLAGGIYEVRLLKD